MEIDVVDSYFEIPKNKKVKVWKYLDLWKFVDFISTKSIYFTKAEFLKKLDPYDGEYPDMWYKTELVTTADTGETKLEVQDDYATEKRIMRVCDGLTFISCWNVQEYESAAMWKIYTQNSQGIAIQTSYDKLINSIDEKIKPGLVKYIDFETMTRPDGEPLRYRNTVYFRSLLKHKAYSYENELRLIYAKHDQEYIKGVTKYLDGHKFSYAYDERPGIHFPITNFNDFIENIYASPFMEKWKILVLNKILNKFGSDKQVQKSSLYFNE